MAEGRGRLVAEIVCIRVDWDRKAIPLRIVRYHAVHVLPEPGYPFGRKGLALAGAWRQLSGPKMDGMLILDGDVAIDPLDHAVMFTAIGDEPDAVQVAPVKLWPISTHRKSWVWGHGQGDYSQLGMDEPDVFTFSYTYLPRALIEACIEAGMEDWTYPGVDRHVSEVARESGIPVRVVWDASPKHLNF
jgi:hypothetical protein